jgi:hypothetical protein
MDDQVKPWPLRKKLIAIPAIWLIIVAAGAAGMPLQPSFAGAALSLTVYILLLAAFSCFTTIGRRAGLGIFLGAVPLYLLVCMILYLLVRHWQVPSEDTLTWLFAGGGIGFVDWNENHTLGGVLLVMAMNLLGPIVLVIAPRTLADLWPGSARQSDD